MNETQAERTLQLRSDARELTFQKQEALLREIGDNTPTPEQNDQIAKYRSDLQWADGEIDTWMGQVEADRKARERSDAIRRAQNSSRGITVEEDGQFHYRTMASYARDFMLTHTDKHIRSAVENSGVQPEEIQRAHDRMQALERAPATTLTSDIAGLSPPQHIAQIFQVIDNSRPLVSAAGNRATLNRLTLTYPQLDASPVVAAQGTQKTEAGNTGMDVSMVTKTATTYLGGGNLSWQAIEFSDPSAFDLWFRLAAAHYALMTETDAATVVSASAFLNNISSTLAGTPTFAQLMTAIGAGGADVYANSGRTANAVIMAPDRYWYALGLTSDASLVFGNGGSLAVDPEGRQLRVIVSRGLNAGEIIVGDLDGLLVAENAGAPVRMFVSEPAIAGVEVGLVGAFEAAVVDDGAFALITTAS